MEDYSNGDEDDLDEYSFSTFASMYFQGAATPTHVFQRLRQPLLHHEDKEDIRVLFLSLLHSSFELLLLEVYVCLLTTALLSSSPGLADGVVDHPQVHGRSPRAQDADKGPQDLQTPGNHPRSQEESFFLKKLNVLTTGSCTLQNGRDDTGEGPTLDRPLTALEKLHVIVGYAIVRSDLR